MKKTEIIELINGTFALGKAREKFFRLTAAEGR